MLIVCYLEELSLLVEAHKGKLAVHLNVRPPGGIFIRHCERALNVPDRRISLWFDSLDIYMRFCSPFALLFVK